MNFDKEPFGGRHLGGVLRPTTTLELVPETKRFMAKWPWVKIPYPPVNIPIPTKIGSKMGGAPTPKWLVLTHSQVGMNSWGSPGIDWTRLKRLRRAHQTRQRWPAASCPPTAL